MQIFPDFEEYFIQYTKRRLFIISSYVLPFILQNRFIQSNITSNFLVAKLYFIFNNIIVDFQVYKDSSGPNYSIFLSKIWLRRVSWHNQLHDQLLFKKMIKNTFPLCEILLQAIEILKDSITSGLTFLWIVNYYINTCIHNNF